VTTLNVLLAIESPLLGDLLTDRIRRQPDMEVVGELGEAGNPLDLLLAIDATDADVVIQSWTDRQEAPDPSCSHLFAQHPDLLVIGVPPNATRAYLCQQRLSTRPLALSGLEDILSEIRTSTADDSPAGDSPTDDQHPQM